MENLKELSEKQLITRADKYCKRMQKLSEMVDEYLNGKATLEECIRKEYAELKWDLREEYSYFQNEKNDIVERGGIYKDYQEGILAAYAHGFKLKANAKVTIGMLNTIDDALFDFQFYFKLK